MRGLLAAVILMVLAVVFTLAWMSWRSPQIRDVPATVTPTVRAVAVFTVTPESLFRATATATPTATPEPTEGVLVIPPTIARFVPTATVTPTVAPTPDKPAVQRG